MSFFHWTENFLLSGSEEHLKHEKVRRNPHVRLSWPYFGIVSSGEGLGVLCADYDRWLITDQLSKLGQDPTCVSAPLPALTLSNSIQTLCCRRNYSWSWRTLSHIPQRPDLSRGRVALLHLGRFPRHPNQSGPRVDTFTGWGSHATSFSVESRTWSVFLQAQQ